MRVNWCFVHTVNSCSSSTHCEGADSYCVTSYLLHCLNRMITVIGCHSDHSMRKSSDWLSIIGTGKLFNLQPSGCMGLCTEASKGEKKVQAVSWTYRRRPVDSGGACLGVSNTQILGNWLKVT